MKDKIKILVFVIVVFLCIGKIFEQSNLHKLVVIRAKIVKKTITGESGMLPTNQSSSRNSVVTTSETDYEIVE
jgi:hypothetical protein